MQIDEGGQPVTRVTVKTPQLAPLNNWVGCCFLYRREVHEVLKGYDEELYLAEDLDFWLRAAASFKLAPLHKDLYLYRRHSGTLTITKQAAIVRAVERAIRQNFSTMTWLTRKDRSFFYAKCAMSARYRDEFGAARQALLKALIYDPAVMLSAENMRLATVLILGARLSGILRQWFRPV